MLKFARKTESGISPRGFEQMKLNFPHLLSAVTHTFLYVCLFGCQGNALVPSVRASSHTVPAVYWLRKAPVSQFLVDKY